MRGLKRRLVTAGAIAVSAAVLPMAVFAGSNGQQIEVTSRYCYNASIYGYNQNGDWVQILVGLPAVNTYIQGYWWVGEVGIDCYDENGNYAGSITTEVPQNQPNSDWWDVAIEPNYGGNAQADANLVLGMGSFLSIE
jgi:hypothetical protein